MAYRNLPEMPCGPILELHGQRKRFHVPFGLKRLLEEMTKEVLRHQPEDINEFLAKFMEARDQKRKSEEEKNRHRKSWQLHRWSWQGSSVLSPEELKEFLAQLGPPPEEIEKHAVVIQSAFRGYQARKKVKEIRRSREEERRKSQASGAGDQGRRSTRKSLLETLTPETATDQEQHSAVIIQSAFRGMQARKMLKERKSVLVADREVRRSRGQSIDYPTKKIPGMEKPRKSLEDKEAQNKGDQQPKPVEKTAPPPAADTKKAPGGGGEAPPPAKSGRRSLVETLTPETATDADKHAAVVIQSAFRGMQARKMVKEKRQSLVAERQVRRSRGQSIDYPTKKIPGMDKPRKSLENKEAAPPAENKEAQPAAESKKDVPAPAQ